jgi:four helix bundle protein
VTAKQRQDRTKKFSLQIILFFRDLPKSVEAQIVGKQLSRSATSVTANYRAACRARSRREFVAKLSIVVEDADETLLWLELIEESKMAENIDHLKKESKELLYIFSASRKSAVLTINKSKYQ